MSLQSFFCGIPVGAATSAERKKNPVAEWEWRIKSNKNPVRDCRVTQESCCVKNKITRNLLK